MIMVKENKEAESVRYENSEERTIISDLKGWDPDCVSEMI